MVSKMNERALKSGLEIELVSHELVNSKTNEEKEAAAAAITKADYKWAKKQLKLTMGMTHEDDHARLFA